MPTETKPVFLLDTMAFIFRAYHAMQRSRPMSTRSGQPTAAIYVFVNMIRRLRQEFGPEYFAAVFDLSGEVFRDEKAREIGTLKKWSAKTQSFEEVSYDGYKANREAMPEDLKRQIPYIRRALEALRIPILAAEGFEADDVIGTLARQAAAAGHPVYIVSGDKDMMQLVTEQVRILNPQKDNLVLDPAKVEEVLGVRPEQVIDVMALRGDAVDNVPGAPGIGDKGSVDLIREFGTLESLLERTAEVKRKSYRESLEQNRDTVLISKELVTIDCHVPLALDLDAMRTQEPDVELTRELFSELEFTTLLKEISAQPAATARVETVIVNEPASEEITAFLEVARAEGFAFMLDVATEKKSNDEEMEAPQTMSLLGMLESPREQKIGVSVDATRALLLPLTEELKALLADATVAKQTHDAKAAMHALAKENIVLAGRVDDVQLLSYALNPTHASQTLADVAARHNQPAPSCTAQAAANVRALVPLLFSELEAENLRDVYETLDRPLIEVLYRMEAAGIRIDREVLSSLSMQFGTEIRAAEAVIHTLAGEAFNINSPKQLGNILFNKLGLVVPNARGKKATSTAQDVLEQLADEHEMPKKVLEYRHLSKLQSTYINALPQLADSRSRIHTTFQAAATATGRLSSVNPNLQNIPTRTALGRSIRAAFVAAPGTVLLSADYSQIELRLLAHYSEDALLLKAYHEQIDIHTLTASEVFGVSVEAMDKQTRDRAKAVNFGIVYGISAFGLSQQLSIPMYEAKNYIDQYFARYAGVQRFIDSLLTEVRKSGSVRTLFGRLRPIPDLESRNPAQRGFAERTAVNTPLQGTAADLMKLAMIRIDAALLERKLDTKMVLQVHDELLFEVPEGERDEVAELVRTTMEKVVELKVPLVADLAFGNNWKEL